MDKFLKFRRTKKDPVILVGFVILICALGYLLCPALKASRDVSNLRACTENVKQLRTGLSAYLMDHGKYPGELSELYPKYIGKIDTFVCPAKKRTIKNAESIDSYSGYVLLMPNIKPSKDCDQPLICDRRGNHLNKFNKLWCGNVLYCDGIINSPMDSRAVDALNYKYDFPE